MSWVLPSSKYNVERSTAVGTIEDQFSAMVLFDDAFRERESDAPPTLLRRESRLENARPQTGRNTRSVVGDTNANAAVGKGRCGEVNMSTPTRERVDGILCEYLDGPFQQHWVSVDALGIAFVLHVDRDRVRQCRYSSAKIRRHAIDEIGDIHGLDLRFAPDALEGVGDAIEPLEIGPHVPCGCARRGILGALLEELDPAG